MTIKTKFNIGQQVHFVHEQGIKTGEVRQMTLREIVAGEAKAIMISYQIKTKCHNYFLIDEPFVAKNLKDAFIIYEKMLLGGQDDDPRF
jgi:hypothetical protein